MSADWLSPAVNALNSATNANLTAAYDTWNILKATTQNAGANWKVTLPAPALSSGKIQFVAVEVDSASTQGINLVGNAGTENIGPGTATSRVLWAGESAILYTDGTNWFKVAGETLPMSTRFQRAAAQTIPNNSITKVLVDTQLWSYGLMGDLANSRIIARRAARYLVALFERYDVTSTSESDGLVYVNGAEAYRCPGFGSATVTNVQISTGQVIDCQPGDIIELEAYHNFGGATNLSTAIPTNYSVTEIPSW